MISASNPVSGSLDPAKISLQGLRPLQYQLPNGQPIFYFVDNHIDLLRLDFTFEAGMAFQTKRLVANAALRLLTEGTSRHSASEVADFLDFRGIIVEKQIDAITATLTFYTHIRHFDALLSLLCELFTEAAYPQHEFEVYVAKQRQAMQANFQKTSYVARIRFDERLFGFGHPLGTWAQPSDYDALTVDDIRDFYHSRYRLNSAHIVVSGNVTASVLEALAKALPAGPYIPPALAPLPQPQSAAAAGLLHIPLAGAAQNSLRIGRILPFGWDDPQFADFMQLATVLGGYFGSRLVANIREDKGYTYGINASTRIYRGCLVFTIVSDVASDVADAAVGEIFKEIELLLQQPVPDGELEVVRNYMLGDFIRSIDGVFERAERYRQLHFINMTEQFTANFLQSLQPASSQQAIRSCAARLQHLAQTLLNPDDLTVLNVGQ